MPGPYEKFETAFETFQTELRQELHEELETLRQSLATAPQAPQEAPNLREELAAFREELLTEVQTLLLQIPQEKPNPLAFYDVILKIRSHRRVGHGFRRINEPDELPYFPDVYNEVLNYFGGYEKPTPLGKYFIAEAKKRFSYLVFPSQPDVPLIRETGVMVRVEAYAMRQKGIEEPIFLDFDERDFAVLRQLLEDLFSNVWVIGNAKGETFVVPKNPQLRQADDLPKQIISADLAELLGKTETEQ